MNMSEPLDSSFEGRDSVDLTSVIAEFPNNDDFPGKMLPKKKLSQEFEGCIKSDEFMKVFLRIRPISSKSESTILAESDTSILTTAPESSRRAQYTKLEYRNYIFSKVFGPNTQQDEVYEQAASPLLARLFNGENCVLFAYGMTNAGKTYTIQGEQQNPGLLPRLITAILQKCDNNCKVEISMLEIYQEKIYDLLSKSKEKLSIRDNNGKVEVCKLSTHPILSADEATKLMCTASSRRSKASTFLNNGSSRSHAVYTVTLRQQSDPVNSTSNRDSSSTVSSEFHLVDLAGSERSNRTKASIAQQKEANNINVSLMQLWRCLQGMRRNRSADSTLANTVGCISDSIIPFRESKLTHLLMPILSRAGSGGVSMIACVNPHVDDYDETLSILGNASLALKIKEFADFSRSGNVHMLSKSASTSEELKESIKTEYGKLSQVSRPSTTAGLKRRWVDGGSLHSSAFVAGGQPSNAAKKRSTGKPMTHATIVAHCEGSSEDAESAMERMQREMEQLRQENLLLAQSQLSRESEIRMEVSREMAQRSNHLLEQIQDLRDQLAFYESQRVCDVKKSVKKARKQQLDTAQEGASSDLREAEEELERVKANFESQIQSLLSAKSQLETELNSYREKYNLKSESAAELALRLQRDPRFSNKESAVTNNNSLKIAQKSPTRSPLNTVTSKYANSPKTEGVTSPGGKWDFNTSNNCGSANKPSAIIISKKVTSPQRIRSVVDENHPTGGIAAAGGSGAAYMTRLRSNAMRL